MPDPTMGMTNEETAYAKINLALHVRERLPDGYHRIETIFAFLDQGDVISVEPADKLMLEISGPFSNGLSSTDNLVLQAARRLAEVSGVAQGARLHLDKRLPVASGIGGGSADAAATLRLLNRFWGLDHSLAALADIAKPLGADVPACVHSRTCRGTGIGQDLAIIAEDVLQGCAALLINPLVAVSTGDIFAAWARSGRNDLQKPAVALVPILTDMLQMLDESQPIMAQMSGSGATCFALYDTLAAAAEAERHSWQAADNIWTMKGEFR